MKFGTPEQQARLLPKMATGEIRAAFSMSEPELGSDVAAIKASAHQDRRRRLRAQRREDVGHQRAACPGVVFVLDAHRPRGVAAASRADVLHRREGAGRVGEPGADRAAEDQEARLQGRRVDRAGLRRLPLPGGHDPRRRGGGPEQGLRADDGRAGGRPRERRRARRRDRAAGVGAGAEVRAGAARRSASRSPSTRRSSSSSPTWPPRSRPRGC